MTRNHPALAIQDADPDAWRGEKRPDFDPDLLRLMGAWERLKKAQAACDSHEPPFNGPEWAEKTRAYADARRDLDGEFERVRGGAPQPAPQGSQR